MRRCIRNLTEKHTTLWKMKKQKAPGIDIIAEELQLKAENAGLESALWKLICVLSD